MRIIDEITSRFKTFIGSVEKEPEDDPLMGLKSLNTKKEERKKQTIKKVLILLFVGPAILFAAQVLVKTAWILATQKDESEVTKQIPREKLSFGINNFTSWQDLTNSNIENLNTGLNDLNLEISNVKQELKVDIENTNTKMESSLNDAKKEIIDTVTTTMTQSIDNLSNTMEGKIANVKNENDALINNNLQDVKKEINDIKNTRVLNNNMPPLPPLNGGSGSVGQQIPYPIQQEKRKPVYETVEETIETKDFKISTLEQFEAEDEKKPKVPTFTLMPGFAKGVIVAGADVPTMEAATTEPKPIFISINSEALIANNELMQLQDCLVQAKATGDLAGKRAKMRLESISCVMTDIDGNKFKVNEKIKGWVYGEDGKYGVKGRLVSQEGEIIKRGLPLALVEGMVKMLSERNSNNNILIPTTGGAMSSFAQGTSQSSGQILNKFSEYYLKMLDGLTPYVEIRAKREVTVGFEGSETITPKPVNLFDIDNFESMAYQYQSPTANDNVKNKKQVQNNDDTDSAVRNAKNKEVANEQKD